MTGAPARILVVDMEQPPLETVCRGLLLYGHRCHGVIGAEAALAALRAAAEAGEAFDLVFADLTALGAAGLALARRVREEWPALPVVMATGLAALPDEARARALQIPLLRKPYTPDTLDAAVREALARPTGTV